MKISSSIMAWNEANTIDLALKSITGFADEVIIYDTGSFDGTPKIAREWLQKLNLSGEVKQVTLKSGKDIMNIRLAAWQACTSKWVLMQDGQLVLSEALKRELKRHAKKRPRRSCSVKSLNLMGDYLHYFANRPFMAYHKIFAKKDRPYRMAFKTRPHFKGKNVPAKNYAFNLSRVRPAWRSWYRGELFDRRVYNPKPQAWINEYNRQYKWLTSGVGSSLVEYVEKVEGLSLEDVRRIAPKWYLRQLKLEATPLKPAFRKNLAEVLKQELENPRYRLKKRRGKIIGRWPEL